MRKVHFIKDSRKIKHEEQFSI